MVWPQLSLSLLDGLFVLLLVLVAAGRGLVPVRFFTLYSALASLALVGLAAPKTALIVGGLTVFYLFPFHRLMVRARTATQASPANQRLLLGCAIGGLVLLLVLFKCYRHFDLPYWHNPRLQQELLSLVGVSYFFFRAVGFLHIQSILPIREASPWGLLFFALFPPTLTSGPVHKFQDFRQQLNQPAPLDRATLSAAAYRITRGYFRKLILAASCNALVEHLLATPTPHVFASVLLVAALYLYFYFDFAGYSDIAIGLGQLLGIRVPENFRRPFLATTISEFWRNWHITLVDWFRDQVFIPLGGMHASKVRAAAIAALIMILCGLWHGLTWSFVAWGCWHAALLASEALFSVTPLPPAQRQGPRFWWRILWTNSRVALGALFFLPDTTTLLRTLRGFLHWPGL